MALKQKVVRIDVGDNVHIYDCIELYNIIAHDHLIFVSFFSFVI